MNNITSLMMVTYNRLDLTKRMMRSLFSTVHEPFRLIIIDNGSEDGTIDFLKNLKTDSEYCITLDYFLNKNNTGVAYGRNQALLLANKYQDPYLCTIDNDIEFPQDWLSKCLSILQVFPKMMVGVNLEGVSYPQITRNGLKFQLKLDGNLGTACMVFPRKLHELIGFFTTELEKYAHEDANIAFRARLHGYELGYLLEAGIHLGEGQQDIGPYREFKTECSKKGLDKFRSMCYEYMRNQRPIYIPFNDPDIF